MTAAIAATVIGPFAMWARLGMFTLFGAFRFLAQGNITGHRKSMISLYIGACLVAGLFTLVPGRFLGDLLWK